jgi:uncharacterized protein YdiU (UPF0061 family)
MPSTDALAPEAKPAAPPTLRFAFDNSYARELKGAYVEWKPSAPPAPKLIKLNTALAAELGFDVGALQGPEGLAMLSGQNVPAGAEPIAQAYAGHQFGAFSPQLGDGRALLLGEVIDRAGARRDIAFKGSGRTPFSRGGDGKAALGPALREYIVGEAMQALGIPTTRVLAVVATGEPVYRETTLPGAVLTRVAASHLRVGTFEFFAARGDEAMLRRLLDYALERHAPQEPVAGEAPALALLRAVMQRQAALVARWMGVGFIHGVMNTDNMTISGETIDYGPCAFMEAFDPGTAFSSIDTNRRYAWGRQGGIAQWNLARLAEALLPLIDADSERAVQAATSVLERYQALFRAHWLAVLRAKLGLDEAGPGDEDQKLADEYLRLMQEHAVDFTLGFRRLVDAAGGNLAPLRALFGPDVAAAGPLPAWLERWQRRAAGTDPAARAASMARANPIYIARNHQVEAALAAAVNEANLAPTERLLAVLAAPFDEREAEAAYAEPAPALVTAGYRTFCGT